MRRVVRSGVWLLVVIGACTNGSDASSPSQPRTTTTSSESASTVPTRFPTADVSLTGDAGLAGGLMDPSVRCNFPALEGMSIAVLGRPTDGTLLSRVGLWSGRVKVIISSVSGADYHERAFEGTGVTAFDAAKGAVVDAKLSETAATPGTTRGNVGAISAIKGSIDCGDQTAGSSTVTITGDTTEGALAAVTLDPVRVECDQSPQGDEVAASGLVTVGASTALVSLDLTSDGAVTLTVTLPSTARRYRADGTSKITPDGGHVRADVVEQGASPSAPKLHVEGDLVCGLNAAG